VQVLIVRKELLLKHGKSLPSDTDEQLELAGALLLAPSFNVLCET
jgi:hypothetical protein